MTTQVSTRATSGSETSWWWRHQRELSPYLFIAPFFILFLIFGLYPIVYSLYLSFFKGFGFGAKTFYGFGNYAYMFQDPRYIKSVLNTTYYAAGSVFILTPLALLVALAISSHYVAWKGLYKTALFFPVITSAVVISVLFTLVLDKQFGLLNNALGILGIPQIGWLSDQKAVMPAFILMGIWTYLGINTLYWIAGLNGISKELYEAARVDGATGWQVFWRITLPLLRPITLFMIIQAIIGSYNLFAQPLLLTNGGPSDASLTITLYMYNQGFVYFNVGYASAVAYSMAVLLLILSVANILFFGGYNTAE